MRSEDLLHLLAPYLPTDRFRSLLRNHPLDEVSYGAALLVDISGFTPMTTRLVAEFGPQRASEELKRRINPMFEAIAGQVFQHGGSVIRFLGDGFTAWFDDDPIASPVGQPVNGVLRALCAGLEMQSLMRFFRNLKLKVCIGTGQVDRWVVGSTMQGLADILSGPAVQSMVSLSGESQAGQVMVHRDALPLLQTESIKVEVTESGNAIVLSAPEAIVEAARKHRWPAWAAEGSVDQVLETVRPFVNATVRERVEGGFGDYVGELRNALPLFIQLGTTAALTSDARYVLDRYVGSVQQLLATSGGRLVSVEVSDKGSVIFAVFGAPVAYGDDAERALRVAMNLREMAGDIPGAEVQHIGISRGLLYAGTVGGEVRHEYSIIGDETNVAARLMTVAAPGQILASSAVRKQSGPRIVFRELPQVVVKGRDEPIPVYEPIAIRTGISRQIQVGSRLVGRDTEIEQFRKLIKAVKLGHPRILRIGGEAGIGKSRVVTEMISIATAQNFQMSGGDCISTGRNTAYLPWQELLFSLFGLSVDASAETNTETLFLNVEALLPDGAERLPLLRDVLHLPIPETPTTSSLEGRTRSQALFALITEIIMAKARQQPLLLILEDIQWLDEVSEALTVDLARRLSVQSAPLMLVMTHRPPVDSEHIHSLIQTLDSLHFGQYMEIGELSVDEVKTFVEKHLKALSPIELAQFVYERAQGNPFFIQEVLDTLVETEVIESVRGTLVVRGELQQADLPQTIQGLIQARIDRLSEMDKLVLKVAAVIGREFQLRVLTGSIPVPMPHSELVQRLHTLEARDFSYQSEVEPDLTYMFKHALTQEVTYNGLLYGQRQQLHLAVAETLESQGPDAIERLAYHFTRGGDQERARKYLILAGQKAFREYANQTAQEYFAQALSLTQDPSERFEISRQQILVHLRLGDTQGVHERIPALEAQAKKSERADWLSVIHLFWAHYFTQTSAWADAVREAQHAINYAEEVQDDSLAWEGYMLLRGAMLSLNQHTQVIRADLDRKMQAIAERVGDQRHVIELLLTWFDDLYAEGPDIAIQGALTALSRAEELHDPVLEANCWTVLIDLYMRENNLTAALDATRRQITLFRQIGDRRHEGLTLNRIGWLLANLGQLSDANHGLLDAYRILHQMGDRQGEAENLTYLGIVAEYYHAFKDAAAYHNRALVIQRSLNNEVDMATTLFYKSSAQINGGALIEAEKTLEQARHILEANSRLPYILQTVEIEAALAEVDWHRGHYATAMVRIVPMLARLKRGQIGGLHRPGLAFYRTVQVLEKNGRRDEANLLREKFKSLMKPTLDWLAQQKWDAAFIDNIWYNRMLMRG